MPGMLFYSMCIFLYFLFSHLRSSTNCLCNRKLKMTNGRLSVQTERSRAQQ